MELFEGGSIFHILVVIRIDGISCSAASLMVHPSWRGCLEYDTLTIDEKNHLVPCPDGEPLCRATETNFLVRDDARKEKTGIFDLTGSAIARNEAI